MAQLAATEKLLYYPTNLRAARLIGKVMRPALSIAADGHKTVSVFDPCIGEGLAVEAFIEGLTEGTNLKTIVAGVELDAERAEAARGRFPNVINAGIQEVLIEGKADIIFMNPPYDTQFGRRTELLWLNYAAPFLAPDGVLLWIVSSKFSDYGEYSYATINTLERLGLVACGGRTFPPDSYNEWQQHVFYIRRRHYPSERQSLYCWWNLEQPSASFDQTAQRVSPVGQPLVIERNPSLPPPLPTVEAIHTSAEHWFGPITETPGAAFVPMEPLTDAYSLLVVAGGMVNGLVVDGKIVQASVQKQSVNSQEMRGEKVVAVEQEYFVSILRLCDQEGEITTLRSSATSEEDVEAYNDYLAKHMSHFQEHVSQTFIAPPVSGRWDAVLSRVRAPNARLLNGDGLLPIQKQKAATLLEGFWRGQPAALLRGEMGTGKTVTSLAVAAAYAERRNKKILVITPQTDDLARKWAREANLALRDFGVHAEWVNSISDVERLFAEPGMSVIVIKENIVKRESGWANLSMVHTGKGKCPRCGLPVKPVEKFPPPEEVSDDDKAPNWEKSRALCGHCGEALWTRIRTRPSKENPKGTALSSIAKFIQHKYKNRYVLILDEAHHFKGDNPDRAHASAYLMQGADRSLLLTGTVYNGLASSLFYLLYRMDPHFRSLFAFEAKQRYVSAYGLIKKTTTIRDGEKTYSMSGSAQKSIRIDEVPGAHPSMAALLLPVTVTMTLEEMGVQLPPHHEATLFVSTNKMQESALEALRVAHDHAKKEARGYPPNRSPMGQYGFARTGYLDALHIDNQKIGTVPLHTIPRDAPWPKELALLRLLTKIGGQNEKALIYIDQVNVRPIQHRLIELAARHGMKLVYMGDEVKEREDFIRNALAGDKHSSPALGVITSYELVKEGVDLVFPDLQHNVFFSVIHNATTLAQVQKRIHRLGQTRETWTWYLAYNETDQAAVWTRNAEKHQARQTIQGEPIAGLAIMLGKPTLIRMLQDIAFDSTHYESTLRIDDLPTLPPLVSVGVEAIVAPPPVQPPTGTRFVLVQPFAAKPVQASLFD